MKRLPIKLRILINMVIFSLPILVLTYLMYNASTTNIEFAKQEKLGSELQKPLINTMYAIAQAKLGISDNSALATEKLKPVYDKNTVALKFNPADLISRKREFASFENLKQQIDSKKWDAAFNSTKGMMTHFGDTSNLILDPDLDSYYLMDVVLLALPQMQERLLNIASQIEHLTSDSNSIDIRIQSAILANQLEENDLNRTLSDLDTVKNEDGNFFGQVEVIQTKTVEVKNSLKDKIIPIVQILKDISGGKTIDKTELKEKTLAAIDVAYNQWYVASDWMDILLENRITDLIHQRTQFLIYSAIALFIAILFSVYIGATISESIGTIFQSITELKSTAVDSVEVGKKLNTASSEVFINITKQAAAVEETAASIEEINSMLSISAGQSKEASHMADQTNSIASTGQTEIMAVLTSMNDIAKSSKKIVETLTVIDDIAFQTNLLALNASVEAARAGEQGKGFAVVADAVRALAQKCAVAAKEINQLMKDNVDMINSSQGRADVAVNNLQKIVTSIDKVHSLNKEIAFTSGEQSTALSQIAQAINLFETEQMNNQSSMQNVSQASSQILEQAQTLQKIIQILEIEISGKQKDHGSTNEFAS